MLQQTRDADAPDRSKLTEAESTASMSKDTVVNHAHHGDVVLLEDLPHSWLCSCDAQSAASCAALIL